MSRTNEFDTIINTLRGGIATILFCGLFGITAIELILFPSFVLWYLFYQLRKLNS